MTEEKKHDDKDRKKVSDEKMEDVAAGIQSWALATGPMVKKKDGDKKPPPLPNQSDGMSL